MQVFKQDYFKEHKNNLRKKYILRNVKVLLLLNYGIVCVLISLYFFYNSIIIKQLISIEYNFLLKLLISSRNPKLINSILNQRGFFVPY